MERRSDMKEKKKIMIGIGLAVLLAVIFVSLYIYKQNQIHSLTYNEFLQKVETGQVQEVTVGIKSKIHLKLKENPDTVFVTDNPRIPELKEMLLKQNIEVIEDQSTGSAGVFQGVIALVMFFFLLRTATKMMNKQSSKDSMTLGTAPIEKKAKSIAFADVAGNEEAKDSVLDLVDFIQKPEKYQRYGARMPRGVIFYGPPGTGKTLMAKAIAGEAGVSFFAVSGSDFVQMYVGVGASRIRELFQKARAVGKAVIFIDEIDALGKKRSGPGAGGNDERDQTLNALLTEMSGFHGNEGIIVIAATNRLDILDDALLRPGRFDRQVEIGLPDVKGREFILKLHGKNKPLAKEIDIRKLAKQTVYFSGAMLENLLNEAAIFAAKRSAKHIESSDVDKAFYTAIAGSEKKDRSGIIHRDREITAFHEAGHALITKLVAPENTISKVTIIPSTKGVGGFSMNIPPDKMYYTKKEMEAQIQIGLGGRIAEELIFGEENITTGASNDIEKATATVRDYVKKYGMSKKIGMLNMDVLTQYSTQNSMEQEVIEECKSIMERLYVETKEIMIEHKYYLNTIAEALLSIESLHEEDLDKIMAGENLLDTDGMISVRHEEVARVVSATPAV